MAYLVVYRQLRKTDAAVLAHVVEQDGGKNAVVVYAHAHRVAGHHQGMGYVGLAALAKLTAVLFTGEGQGFESLLHAGA